MKKILQVTTLNIFEVDLEANDIEIAPFIKVNIKTEGVGEAGGLLFFIL